MKNCNGTMCHSLTCTACFPKMGDGWTYHTPEYNGEAPDGLKSNTPFPEGWEVQYKSMRGQWIGARQLIFNAGETYRYKKPAEEAVLDETLSLPDDDAVRGDFPMFDGLIAYFPNALAEVSRVSKIGNDQHNPGQPMHWARDKSLDHENKIVRHLVDAGKRDGRGVRHTARLAWRALAMLQEEIERDEGLPPSRASTDRPF